MSCGSARTICAAQKENFNLLRFAKRSRREYFDVFDLHSDLFAQLATQRIERLFAASRNPPGNPNRYRAKTMFQQQHLSFVIENIAPAVTVNRECVRAYSSAEVAPATVAKLCR
jgi:hypothetical protein